MRPAHTISVILLAVLASASYAKEPRIKVLHREKKQGLGRAYLHAFRWALEHPYQYVIEMDADFSHDPRFLSGLIDTAVDGADVALGSRYVVHAERFYRYRQGFFADHLMRNADALPAHVLKPERRRRVYANQVLARAEVSSSYVPARRLWLRTTNGHYLPNPELQLRVPATAAAQAAGATDASPAIEWRPVYDVLNLALIDEGTAGRFPPGPARSRRSP